MQESHHHPSFRRHTYDASIKSKSSMVSSVFTNRTMHHLKDITSTTVRPVSSDTKSRSLMVKGERFQQYKKTLLNNPDRTDPFTRNPYLIYENGVDFTPKPLYDSEFTSVSHKHFTGLPSSRPQRLTRVEKPVDSAMLSSSSSFTSFVTKMTETRRSKNSAISVTRSNMSLEMGSSLVEVPFGSVLLDSQTEDEEDVDFEERPPSMFRLRVDPPPRKREIQTQFKVTLTESETMFMLQIPMTAVTQDLEEVADVRKENETYEKSKVKSKTISHTATQTTRVFQKHRKAHIPRNHRANSSSWATVWDIYDTMAEEACRMSEYSNVSVEEGLVTHSKGRTEEEEDPYREAFEYEGQMFDRKLLTALMVMERLVVHGEYREKQLLFQGLLLQDPLSLHVTYEYTLEHLWTFACEKTKNRKVTSISDHVNENIIIVGYGKFKYADKCNGLVCVWNVKNPKEPERLYEFEDPVTSVSNHEMRPTCIIVTFYSGLIIMLDFISRSVLINLSNATFPRYYPVWQTIWFQQVHADTPRTCLLTCGKNGAIYRYQKDRTLTSKQLMTLSRPHGNIQGVHQPKKCYARKILVSRHPSAEVMIANPNDPSGYVVGSAEGYVYFCSVDRRHDHLEVFVAHNGPVYNIEFNPFCSKIFLTCGADCCIRIWADGIFEPLITLESGMSPVQHALWNPLNSTIIVSITETLIEVWDIRRRISTPKSSMASPSNSFNTFLQFTRNKYNLAVGDDQGNVHVMALTAMPFSPAFQEAMLAQSIRNMLITRPDMLEKLEKLGHPFATQDGTFKAKLFSKLHRLQTTV